MAVRVGDLPDGTRAHFLFCERCEPRRVVMKTEVEIISLLDSIEVDENGHGKIFKPV
jgi:hypothetical protein